MLVIPSKRGSDALQEAYMHPWPMTVVSLGCCLRTSFFSRWLDSHRAVGGEPVQVEARQVVLALLSIEQHLARVT